MKEGKENEKEKEVGKKGLDSKRGFEHRDEVDTIEVEIMHRKR